MIQLYQIDLNEYLTPKTTITAVIIKRNIMTTIWSVMDEKERLVRVLAAKDIFLLTW